MRIGILGGSFDPVHYGHLLLAECCREDCQLDQVWLTPAAIPPHKRQREPTPAKARLEMLQLAAGGHAGLEVCSLEIDRGGVSYTVDTLATITRQQTDAQLFLLMGADTLQDLPNMARAFPHFRVGFAHRGEPIFLARSELGPDPWFDLAGSADRGTAVHRAHAASRTEQQRDSAPRGSRLEHPLLDACAVQQYIQAHHLYRD